MTSPTILQLITAISAIATPIILAVFAGVGWAIRQRVEANQKIESELRQRTRKLEEELREDRLKVYNEILEPFIILLTKDEGFVQEERYQGKSRVQVANEKMMSVSYRQAAFKLSLFGSDNVVTAFNDLMQLFYSQRNQEPQEVENTSGEIAYQVLAYFGNLLLEIRKSVGNETTTLKNWDMLEWLITDARKIQVQYSEKGRDECL